MIVDVRAYGVRTSKTANSETGNTGRASVTKDFSAGACAKGERLSRHSKANSALGGGGIPGLRQNRAGDRRKPNQGYYEAALEPPSSRCTRHGL
jgi:hypothetical protein